MIMADHRIMRADSKVRRFEDLIAERDVASLEGVDVAACGGVGFGVMMRGIVLSPVMVVLEICLIRRRSARRAFTLCSRVRVTAEARRRFLNETIKQRFQRREGHKRDPRKMLNNRTERRLRNRPRIILRKHSLQQHCLRNRAARRQRAQAHQAAQRALGAMVDAQAAQDADRHSGADEVREGVEPEADVPREVGDVRGEAFPWRVGVPDGGHGAALHDEEEDLGQVAGGDEGDDGV